MFWNCYENKMASLILGRSIIPYLFAKTFLFNTKYEKYIKQNILSKICWLF